MKLFFTLLFLLVLSPLVNSFSLDKSVLYDRGASPRTEEERQASYVLYDVVKTSGFDIFDLIALTNMGLGKLWYSFGRDLTVRAVNVETETYHGNWSLTRWEHQNASDFLIKRYANIWIEYPYALDQELFINGEEVGCLSKKPLRYGNIHADSKVLVVFLQKIMLVFDPVYERIIFAEKFDQSDAWNTPLSEEYLNGIGLLRPESPQYMSEVYALEKFGAGEGVRAYSKLYFDDFDGDGHQDIVSWRKVFLSNVRSNTQQGFHLVEEEWQHYERNLTEQASTEKGVTGEYLPQTTPEATLQQWLADKELTWQKGFPSHSECEGQEGQLIPEMHDPLLNDPEVLQ